MANKNYLWQPLFDPPARADFPLKIPTPKLILYCQHVAVWFDPQVAAFISEVNYFESKPPNKIFELLDLEFEKWRLDRKRWF